MHVREYMYMLIFAHAKIRVHTYVHYILHASVLDAHTNLDIDILNIHMYSHVSASFFASFLEFFGLVFVAK